MTAIHQVPASHEMIWRVGHRPGRGLPGAERRAPDALVRQPGAAE